MKVPVIRKIVEQYSIQQLRAAEEALLDERKPEIEVEGEDEGEQLTHVIAAITILSDVEQHGVDLRTAMKQYFERVRKSIS